MYKTIVRKLHYNLLFRMEKKYTVATRTTTLMNPPGWKTIISWIQLWLLQAFNNKARLWRNFDRVVGDMGLFITLVLFVGLTTLGRDSIKWHQNFVHHYRGCTSIYQPMSYSWDKKINLIHQALWKQVLSFVYLKILGTFMIYCFNLTIS